MKVDALSQHSPFLAAFSRLGGQLLANLERRDATTLKRSAHEVHEAGRAKKGPGEKRYNEGLRIRRVVHVGGLGSSLPGPGAQRQKVSIRDYYRVAC